MEKTTVKPLPEIDECWLMEWFELGFAELGAHLAKYAQFDEYYANRSESRIRLQSAT